MSRLLVAVIFTWLGVVAPPAEAISHADYVRRASAVCRKQEARINAASEKYLTGSLTDPKIFDRYRRWAKRMRLIVADYDKGLTGIPARADARRFLRGWRAVRQRLRVYIRVAEQDGPLVDYGGRPVATRLLKAGRAWARASTRLGAKSCGRRWARKETRPSSS